MFLVDKYISLLSTKLENFQRKGSNLWAFRCPFCGDSKKNKFKTRGYIYKDKEGKFSFKCHNCGKSSSFSFFLNEIDPQLYKEFLFDNFHRWKSEELWKSEEETKIEHVTPKFEKRIENYLPKISELDKDSECFQYVSSRNIPDEYYSSLFYAEDFKNFVDTIYPEYEKNLKEDEPRLVIPFYDEDGFLLGFQGRAIKENKIRYITIKLCDDNLKLFGMERVKKDNDIYVLEGPIDSLFLPNAIATTDINLQSASKYYPKNSLILVFDNQYSNKDVKRHVQNSITQGFRVVIFPSSLDGKDINDFIQNGLTKEKVLDLIKSHTFSGLRAQLEFDRVKG